MKMVINTKTDSMGSVIGEYVRRDDGQKMIEVVVLHSGKKAYWQERNTVAA